MRSAPSLGRDPQLVKLIWDNQTLTNNVFPLMFNMFHTFLSALDVLICPIGEDKGTN